MKTHWPLWPRQSMICLFWLKEHTQKSHNPFQVQNNKHTHQHYRHSSHTKNSYYNKPDLSNRHRLQNAQYSSKNRSQYSSHNRSHHNSQNRSHNRQHKYNTKINEIDDLSDCSPDCSDRSDCEDYCTDHETQEVEDPKNLSIPSQEPIDLPDNLRGPDISSDENRQTKSVIID